MNLVTRIRLLAFLLSLPPLLVVGAYAVYTSQSHILELHQRTLDYELARVSSFAADEYARLERLGISQTEFYRKNIENHILDWIRSNQTPGSSYSINDFDGVVVLPPTATIRPVLQQHVESPQWRWTIYLSFDEERVYGFFRMSIWGIGVIAILSVIASFLAGGFFARKITVPLLDLHRAALEMAGGNLSRPAIASTTVELNDLATSFNTMAARIVDLTRGLEDRVEQRTRELDSSLQELRLTQDELIRREKLASLGLLVAGVAHEINTPLGICLTSSTKLEQSIKSFYQKYLDQTITKGAFEDFFAMLDEGVRLVVFNLGRATDLVQSFKRIGVEEQPGQTRDFALDTYIGDITASLSHDLKIKKARFELVCDGPQNFFGTPSYLYQIIVNLIVNSLTHGFVDGKGSLIRLHCNALRDRLQLEYHDDGRGMPVEVVQRVFEPFFTTNPDKGSGLGMSLVRNIIESKFGGTIKVESRENEGAHFSVSLPYGPHLRPKSKKEETPS